jgi:hypothetical protein
MNERIKLLAEQAGVKYSLWVGSKPAAYMTYDELEKFAELLVRECAEIADRAEPYKADDLILKHFGVER